MELWSYPDHNGSKTPFSDKWSLPDFEMVPIGNEPDGPASTSGGRSASCARGADSLVRTRTSVLETGCKADDVVRSMEHLRQPKCLGQRYRAWGPVWAPTSH